jgi:prefoldin subunit 5
MIEYKERPEHIAEKLGLYEDQLNKIVKKMDEINLAANKHNPKTSKVEPVIQITYDKVLCFIVGQKGKVRI